MNPIVSDIVIFVETGEVPESLRAAHDEVGRHMLRKVCVKLLDWWRRSFLLASDRASIQLLAKYDWSQPLRTVVDATPQLGEMLDIRGETCRLHENLQRQERIAVHNYVCENYVPWRPE